MRLIVVGLSLVSMCVAGCRTSSAPQDQCLLREGESLEPRLCAAYRGNGPYIWAHIAATARLVEHYGLVEAVAGGSSGSITSFLYESVYANPLLRSCGSGSCPPEETAARASLWLKSLQGYVELLGDTEEAIAVKQLVPIFEKAVSSRIHTIMAEDAAAGASALLSLLTSKELHDIVDREAIDLLKTSERPALHARLIWGGIAGLGSWKVNDNKVFFRPGVVDFGKLARKLGRIANFYAGYGPYDREASSAFLAACAAPSKGKAWAEIRELGMPDGGTCGGAFDVLLGEYRATLVENEVIYASRIDDKVGKYLPALVPTAIVEGAETVAAFEAARRAFLNGEENPRFPVDFERVRIGFYGQQRDLDRVAANAEDYDDAKTKRFTPLADATWAEALTYSPAEPGLTRLRALSSDRLSASGWFELHPTLALRNLGCRDVVYVTTPGDEGDYPIDVARQLGMTDEQQAQIYDLDRRPPSAFALSIKEAQGVWCSQWETHGALDIEGIFTEAYNAPLEARSGSLRGGASPYPNAKRSLGLRGCSVGAPPLPR